MMSRYLFESFRLAISLAFVGIFFTHAATAQDLSDIDMFGDSAQEEPAADVADDPLNLDDFGSPELEPTAQGGEPEQKTFEQALAEGIEFADAGKMSEAIQVFNEILAFNANYAPASLELGAAYFGLEEYELARQQFENALNTGAPFPGVVGQATIELGNVYMEQGLYTEAEEAFGSAVRADPSDSTALRMRAKAQIRSASAFAAGPGAGELIESAIRSLDRSIAIDPENTESYIERSKAKLFLRRFDQAIEDSDKALSLDGKSSDTIARRAFTYFTRGGNERTRYDADLDAAISDLQVAVDGFNAYLAIEGDKKKEDFEDADPEAVRPDQILASKAEAQIVIGNELGAGQGSSYYYQAIEDANRLIEYDPDAPSGFYHRGVAQRLLGDLRGAVASWDKALEIQAGNPEFHLRRGIAWYYLGENRLARRDFEAAEPGFDGRALFWSGVTYAKEGEFEEAIRLYTAALRLAPGFKPAYNNRGLAYMKLGKFSRAEKDFDDLVRRDPEDSRSLQRRDQARQMRESERTQVRTSRYYP